MICVGLGEGGVEQGVVVDEVDHEADAVGLVGVEDPTGEHQLLRA